MVDIDNVVEIDSDEHAASGKSQQCERKDTTKHAANEISRSDPWNPRESGPYVIYPLLIFFMTALCTLHSCPSQTFNIEKKTHHPPIAHQRMCIFRLHHNYTTRLALSDHQLSSTSLSVKLQGRKQAILQPQ